VLLHFQLLQQQQQHYDGGLTILSPEKAPIKIVKPRLKRIVPFALNEIVVNGTKYQTSSKMKPFLN